MLNQTLGVLAFSIFKRRRAYEGVVRSLSLPPASLSDALKELDALYTKIKVQRYVL